MGKSMETGKKDKSSGVINKLESFLKILTGIAIALSLMLIGFVWLVYKDDLKISIVLTVFFIAEIALMSVVVYTKQLFIKECCLESYLFCCHVLPILFSVVIFSYLTGKSIITEGVAANLIILAYEGLNILSTVIWMLAHIKEKDLEKRNNVFDMIITFNLALATLAWLFVNEKELYTVPLAFYIILQCYFKWRIQEKNTKVRMNRSKTRKKSNNINLNIKQ